MFWEGIGVVSWGVEIYVRTRQQVLFCNGLTSFVCNFVTLVSKLLARSNYIEKMFFGLNVLGVNDRSNTDDKFINVSNRIVSFCSEKK